TAEHRLARKNELKARGTLLMALPDKHQLNFNTHKDAKTLMKVIEKRFGGNTETKKVQKTLLKQQYENFLGSSTKRLDQIYDRLQKLISQLEILRIDADDIKEMNLQWKGHFAKECRSPKDTRRNGATEPQRRNVLVETSTSNALLRDNALVILRQTLEKAKQEKDDFKFKLETFQTSFKNLSELLASQTNAKIGLGYNSQVFTRAMFDCDDYLSSRTDERNIYAPKPDLVFNNAPNNVKIDHLAFNVKLSPTKPDQDLSHTHRTSEPIIKDWVSDSDDESETKTPQNAPNFVQPTEQVKSPRLSVQHVETSIPTATSKTAIPKSIRNGRHKNRKACFVCKSLDHLIKDYDYHEKKMAQL
nr:ribonuclease H-like domain-containing protein [Tanacetum cinerariifolium]